MGYYYLINLEDGGDEMKMFWNNMFDVLILTGVTDMGLLLLLIGFVALEMKYQRGKISKILRFLIRLMGWMMILKILTAIVTLIFIDKRFFEVLLLVLVIICYTITVSLFFPNMFKKIIPILRRRLLCIKLWR